MNPKIVIRCETVADVEAPVVAYHRHIKVYPGKLTNREVAASRGKVAVAGVP